MLVVIFIIGVLAALILVAVNRSREMARRTQCLSNLRQIGVAMNAFASQNGVLPNSGTFENSRDFFARNGGPPSGNSLMWAAPLWGWGLDLLPFIEREQVLDKWDLTKPFFDPGWPVGEIPPDQQPAPESNFVLSQTPTRALLPSAPVTTFAPAATAPGSAGTWPTRTTPAIICTVCPKRSTAPTTKKSVAGWGISGPTLRRVTQVA